MKEILDKMSPKEEGEYKKYIENFVEAMKVFCGIKQPEEKFYESINNDVNRYVELMHNYLPELRVPEELGEQAVRFFVIQEVNRIYKER